MSKASAVAEASPNDGMDGYVPVSGSLLDAEMIGDSGESFSETPYSNSGLQEITGDPEEEELLEEETEELDADDGEEEEVLLNQEGEKKKNDSYWQSRHDKLASEMQKYQRIAGYEGVIDRLQNDPEAAKLLMDHWTRPSQQASREPEIEEPDIPEDFDPNMIGVKGSSSYKYWRDQQAFHRDLARREAREEARRAAEEATRPIAEEREAARNREQIVAVLSKTTLPVDEYESFVRWTPPVDGLARLYLESKGVSTATKAKVSEKAKEFAKVKENGEKAGAVKKIKGEGPSAPLTDEQNFMASLKAAAGTSRYKS